MSFPWRDAVDFTLRRPWTKRPVSYLNEPSGWQSREHFLSAGVRKRHSVSTIYKRKRHYSTYMLSCECWECLCRNEHLIDFLRIAANHHGAATRLKMRADSPMIEKDDKHRNFTKLNSDHWLLLKMWYVLLVQKVFMTAVSNIIIVEHSVL